MVAFSAPVGRRSHCTRRARLLQPLRRNPFLARPMSAIHPSLAEPPRRLESRPSRSVLNPTGCGPTLEVPHPRGTDERRFTSARRAVALAAALALGCRATPAPARGDAHATAPPASAAPQPALPSRLDGAANHGLVAAEPVSAAPIQAAQVVFVQGHELSLSPTPGPCVVSQRAGGARVARRITLALEGPCFFVSWVRPPPPPPGPGSVSDGVPLGAKGDVRGVLLRQRRQRGGRARQPRRPGGCRARPRLHVRRWLASHLAAGLRGARLETHHRERARAMRRVGWARRERVLALWPRVSPTLAKI